MDRSGDESVMRPVRWDGTGQQSIVRQLFDHSPVAMAVVDVAGRFLDVNPAWLMFGDEKATPLTDEAREVAESWMALSEGERDRVRNEIRMLAGRRMSS